MSFLQGLEGRFTAKSGGRFTAHGRPLRGQSERISRKSKRKKEKGVAESDLEFREGITLYRKEEGRFTEKSNKEGEIKHELSSPFPFPSSFFDFFDFAV
jgi:hypothetical protein